MGIWRKKSVRVLGVLLTVLLLAVIAVKIFLPAEKIRDLALDQARARLGREVSVGKVAVSLRGGLGVRLSDFAVHNPDGFGGDNLLTSRALELKLAIQPLFKGEIRVDGLVVDTPVLNLAIRADGTNNFTFAPVAAEGEKGAAGAAVKTAPPPLSVANFTVRDGEISFADARAASAGLSALRVAGLALGLSLNDPAPGRYQVQGKVSADKILVTGPAAVPELNAVVDFDLIWDAEIAQLDINRADALLLDIPLTCTGKLVMAEGAPVGKLQFKLTDLSLVDLAALAPPELAAKITGDQNSGRLGATVDLEMTGQPETLPSASGTITVSNADLALGQPFLPPQQKGRLAGRADLNLTFANAGADPSKMTYGGTATARSVSFTESGLVDDLQNLDATLSFTPEEITVESCQARFASGSFDMTGSLRDPLPYFLPPELQGSTPMKTPHLNFVLHSPRLDVDRLLPAASPTGAKGVKGKPAPRTPAFPADMEFPELSCDGTFAADSLIYMQVPLTKVTGQVKLRDRVLSCNDVKGAVYQGRVGGQVNIDLNKLSDPAYTGSYQASDIEVNDFVTRFAGLGGLVFGGCNMSGSFAARGLDPDLIRNSLTLNSDAGVKQGKIITKGSVYEALNLLATQTGNTMDKEQTLRDLATHITVKDGRVGLNDLKTSLGQFGDLTVDGYYAFSGELNYTGRILLTKAQTDLLFSGGILGELGKLLGTQRPERLDLPLTVGGTRTAPRVKLDLATVTGDLQQRVTKEQGKKLEDTAKSKLNDLLKKWK